MNVDDPTIPVDCATFALPTAVAATDCYKPTTNFGCGRNLYWSKTPFTATPTALLIAAKKTAGDLIGPVVGEFAYDGNAGATIRVDGRDIAQPGDLTWTVKISSTTPEAREMARQTQDGGSPGHFYIVDNNTVPNWFGGLNGVCDGQAHLLLRNKIPTGEQDLQTIEGTIKGRGKYDSKVLVSPVPCIF